MRRSLHNTHSPAHTLLALIIVVFSVTIFSSMAHAVSVEFFSDSDGSYIVKNSSTSKIDCTAPNVCNVAAGRYRLINFDDYHSVYVTVESNGSVRYTYDGGADFPFAVAANLSAEPQSVSVSGFARVNFLSDNDGAYLVKNSATSNIDCVAPAICDVALGRYRLIDFNGLHSVYVTVENNGSVRYTYDGGADFPFAVTSSASTNSTPATTTTAAPISSSSDSGLVRINFLTDSDGAYIVRNSSTNAISCLAPAICDVAFGRFRLINFDNLHSVYITVESNGSVRYTYDGGAVFPFAVAASVNSTVSTSSVSNTQTNYVAKSGSTFYWQLQGNIYLDHDVDVYGIDLEDNEFNGVIRSLHNRGKEVSCYISAGSYEAWRSDRNEFNLKSDLGNQLGDWPGEYYLDTNSANVRRIMRLRIDRAVAAGCDGLEPDNTDAYQANNGLGLTSQDQINYLLFLANYAHSKGLSIGLKNTVDLIANASVVKAFDWTLNESCYDYNECYKLKPFVSSGKAVYIAMYGTQSYSARCADAASNRFNLSFYGTNQLLNGGSFEMCHKF